MEKQKGIGDELKSVGVDIRQHCESALRRAWFVANDDPRMERIVSRCDSDANSNSARTVPARTAYVMAPEDRPSNTAMNQPLIQDTFQSPRKRRRGLQAQTAETCETTVADIHDMESASIDSFSFTACLLHVPSEPRWVDITDKQSRPKERVPVVTALLTDHTGPITLELWRKQADDVLRKWGQLGIPRARPSIYYRESFLRSRGRSRQSRTYVANEEHRNR